MQERQWRFNSGGTSIDSAHGASADDAYVGPRFDQFSMIVAAAISGLGVGLLPTYLIEEETRRGTLVPLLDLSMSTENAYYVVRPEAKQTHQTADDFQSWLLSQVEQGDGGG